MSEFEYIQCNSKELHKYGVRGWEAYHVYVDCLGSETYYLKRKVQGVL